MAKCEKIRKKGGSTHGSERIGSFKWLLWRLLSPVDWWTRHVSKRTAHYCVDEKKNQYCDESCCRATRYIARKTAYRKAEIGWIDWVKGIYRRAITRVQRVSCATLHYTCELRAVRYLRPEIRVRSRVRKTSGMHHTADPARRFAKKGGSGRWVSERMRDQKIQRRDYNRSLDARARRMSLPLSFSLFFPLFLSHT